MQKIGGIEMKKVVLFTILLFSFVSFQHVSFADDSVAKTLTKADIEITSDGNGNYQMKQVISLKGTGNLSGKKIEHTYSKINEVNPEDLQFVSNQTELEYTTKESDSLVRYFVTIPENTSDSFDYEIVYNLKVDDGVFTTPLFVPLYAATGQENVVKIDFETSEGNIIQRNSFPVLKKAEDNHVTSYLMNIPSHVNYIYGANKNIFNTFNFISWGSILVLLGIVAIWIRSELRQSKGVVN
jgi:hypothetical protein